ncbi:MAG: transposase [Thermodesulfobacteriota bacterium]|nr:MAG: transposase [Thermodesulfobacteriota bacterium]
MPRQARLDAPGTLHHIMIRGIEGITIFRDDDDRKDFLSRVGNLAEKTKTRILAWSLMDNHVHFLLFSGPEGISSFMRKLLTGYAIRFNRKHQRNGHLFQNRYKSIVCEEDPYLLELVRYIHLNPIRALVVKSMQELDYYPWNGHSIVMSKQTNDWQEREYVLSLFGKEKRKAIRAYRKFIEEGEGQGKRPELIGGGLIRSLGGWSQVLTLRGTGGKTVHDGRVLGGGDFVGEILSEADARLKRQLLNKDREQVINKTIKESCAKGKIRESEVRNGGQRREASKVRGEIAYYLSQEMGIPMAEIARHLGVCTSAIAKAVKKNRV